MVDANSFDEAAAVGKDMQNEITGKLMTIADVEIFSHKSRNKTANKCSKNPFKRFKKYLKENVFTSGV